MNNNPKSERFTGPMSDPTYNRDEIRKNPHWELAFVLSEILNDNAPLGWHSYMGTAGCLLDYYDMNRKQTKPQPERV